MGYLIAPVFYEKGKAVEIDAHRHKRIIHALEVLKLCAILEEVFDYLFENYYEFEHEMIARAHRFMLFEPETIDYYLLSEKISRRLMNFMSSARAYLDYFPQHALDIFGADSHHSLELKN